MEAFFFTQEEAYGVLSKCEDGPAPFGISLTVTTRGSPPLYKMSLSRRQIR